VWFYSATFFCARKNASHFSLSGAKKRQLQPERYTTIFLPTLLVTPRHPWRGGFILFMFLKLWKNLQNSNEVERLPTTLVITTPSHLSQSARLDNLTFML